MKNFHCMGFYQALKFLLHIGLKKTIVDSIILIWPDNSYQKINWQSDTGKIITLNYQTGSSKIRLYNELKSL